MLRKKFKEGAASFYIVAFSTLVLMVLATSFAAIIISTLDRTTNDDLSQSAYDSALAGIEDAKLAFYSYQNCLAQGSEMSQGCAEIVSYMKGPQNCDMVANILGRGDGSVEIKENVRNNMEQSYTCVQLQDVLTDYRSTLSSSNMIKPVRVKFENVSAKEIKKIEVSWYSEVENSFNYSNVSGGQVKFQPSSVGSATPPTISVALVQTAETFSFSDFDTTHGSTTDRGMVYLVPTGNTAMASANGSTYYGAYSGGKNYINKNGFLRSNDKTTTNRNLPYAVYCPSAKDANNEFACTATIEIPEPVGGSRNDDTFMFVVGLPYGKPTTDFSLKFFCNDGVTCGQRIDETGAVASTNQASLQGVQIEVDSTGKANDLYRRVVTRLENTDDYALSILGPLELLGSDGSASMRKDDYVITEWNFTN